MRPIGKNAVRNDCLQRFKGLRCGLFAGDGQRFWSVAKEQIRRFERFAKRIPKDCRDELLRTGHGDFCTVFFGHLNRLADRMLAGLRIRKNIPFDEQPSRLSDSIFIDMPIGQVARNPQTRPHRSLGIGSDDRNARPGILSDNHRIAHVDSQVLKLFGVVESIAVVPYTADECSLPPELRCGDHGVGYRTPADQLQLMAPLRKPI